MSYLRSNLILIKRERNRIVDNKITIKATITVDVTYACPLDEIEDFDAKYFLQDTLTVDAYNGDVIVDSFDVEDADIDW